MDIAPSLRTETGERSEVVGRRRAFEANLVGNLTEALGEAPDPSARRTLVSALGEAHEAVGHLIDARAAIGPNGRRRYAVLQLGVVGSAPPVDGGGPLARRVLARVPGDALADLSAPERRAVAACVERSELRNTHPIDWRPRVSLPVGQLYVNLLAGRDRRVAAANAADERRAPVNESFGLAVLSMVVLFVSGLGLWLIGRALTGLSALLSDPRSVELLADLFGS